MTTTCPIITVTAPPAGANITATSIIPSKNSCQALCSLTIDVIWTNQGGTSGTFTPGLQVGSEPPFMLTSETLTAGATSSRTFNITGLTQGSYVICPIPN